MKKIITICLHIEKTAGSTFREILRSVYKKKFVDISHTHTLESAWNILSRVSLEEDTEVIYGHMPYGIHKFFPDSVDYRYITFLRNPVERLMSLWHFDRINDGNRHPFDKGSSAEFMEWAGNIDSANKDNEMTRIISGNDESFVKKMKYFVKEKDYKMAQDNLLSFYFVGLSEKFNDDLLTLSKLMGWNSVPKQERIFSFPERLHSNDLPEMDRRKIEGMQYYDTCLWNLANKGKGIE